MVAAARPPALELVRGARHSTHRPRRGRYALFGRVRGKRWGELPAALPAGRHTSPPVRFVSESAANTNDPNDRSGVVIIAPPSDLLAQLVATSLMYDHVPTCQLDPAELDYVDLEMSGAGVTVNGHVATGLLWRAAVTPGNDPVTSASWLAAASRMRAVNSYDPEAWRRGAGWSVWEDRLGECGVPVRPPSEPNPHSPEATSLIACGAVVSGPETPSVTAAAEALEESGVRLATITSLPEGQVTSVNAHPEVTTSLDARRAAARVAEFIAA